MEEQVAWAVAIVAIVIQGALGVMLFRANRHCKQLAKNHLKSLDGFMNVEELTDIQKARVVRTILNEPEKIDEVVIDLARECQARPGSVRIR